MTGKRAPEARFHGTLAVVRENERWLRHPKVLADLDRALEWARTHPPDDANTDQILANLKDAR